MWSVPSRWRLVVDGLRHPVGVPARELLGRLRHAELGRDDDVGAPRAECPPEELLRPAAAVEVRGVEVVDAGVQRRVDDGTRGVLVDAHPEVVAPEAHDGDVEGADAPCRRRAHPVAAWSTGSAAAILRNRSRSSRCSAAVSAPKEDGGS